MSSVTRTITDDTHSGMMWRSTMRHGEAPIISTAAMYSVCRIVSVSARAIRAYGGHDVMAIAITAFSIPGPSAATNASARIKPRKREEDVGDAHQRRVDEPAGITGDRADGESDRRGEQRDEHDDDERDPRAEDHARGDVAALVVGAEPVCGRRRKEPRRAQVADVRRIRREAVGEDRDEHERHDDQQAGDREPIRRERPPCAVGADRERVPARARPVGDEPRMQILARAGFDHRARVLGSSIR